MQKALFETPRLLAVTVYTDGGCDPNPGPGGWAAVVSHGESQVVLTGNASMTTNNQMELEAAIAALAYLSGRYGSCQVELHTDSRYLRQGITAWIDGWFARGWRTKGGQPIKNQELWRRLYELSQAHQMQWVWVKGHAGNPLNERVDRLATEARASLVQGADVTVGVNQDAVSGRGSEVELWIAISFQGNSGPGGWAVVLCDGEQRQVLQGIEAQTTSNALYLSAAIEGLKKVRQPSTIAVYAQSDYLIQGAAQWALEWQQRGWQTKSGSPVKNRAQWKALLQAAQPHRVRWCAIRGGAASPDLAEAKRTASAQFGR